MSITDRRIRVGPGGSPARLATMSEGPGTVGLVDPERLLDGLNEPQRRAVTSSVVPLCILAGAGSGKTRVLTRRIAYRAATDAHDPQRVLALTFTRKAAGELRNRLRQLGLRDSVAAGTFHSVAYAQLRARWADRNIAPPALLDRKVGFVSRLVPKGLRAPSGRDVVTLDIVSEIEWAKARRVTPDQYPSAAKAANRTPPIDARQLASIFDRYETDKRAKRMVDFDDLLSLCARDLGRDETFAAAQRWRFRHLFVDEYQDVNPLQQALLEAWLGDRVDLCVVGDPNQAIYAWNGADARFLNRFTDRWGSGEVVSLTDNYRSSPQILAVANAVLAGGAAARRAAQKGEGFTALTAHRSDGPLPVITECADDRAEARAVARSVRDHHAPGAPWSAQAVLVRTNAQAAVIEEALREARIPFRVRGGGALLDQPEVKAAMAELRRSSSTFAVALADLAATAARVGPTEGRSPTGDAVDERQANLEALVRMGSDYAAIDADPSVPGFLAWLAQTARADQPDQLGDAVDLSTFHAAKGLEWPIVHLAGVEQGLVPIGHAQTPAQQAEERRLFYVAITRAERELSITWARERTFGTKTVGRDRSLYLTDVDAALTAARAGDIPADWATHVSDERRRATDRAAALGGRSLRGRGSRASGRATGGLSTLDDGDESLLDALKGWRATVAKGAAVAPHVVFHDTTLVSIARARPRSVDDLLALGGVGPVKAKRYGHQILEVVATHA
jgi:DNA helicase-2/ATP-dependent DNA helicase PcrA